MFDGTADKAVIDILFNSCGGLSTVFGTHISPGGHTTVTEAVDEDLDIEAM